MSAPVPTSTERALRFPLFWWIVGLAQLAIMLYLALIPIPAVATGPAYSDKIIHFLAFAYLMTWFSGLGPRNRDVWLLVLLAAYGLGMEWLQSFAPARQAEPADLLADVLGLLTGWLIGFTRVRRWPVCIETLLSSRGGGRHDRAAR